MQIREHITLAPYTTFGIGGPADFFVEVFSEEELIDAVAFARDKNLKVFLLGTGANILIGDKGFAGLVIKNEAKKTVMEQTILTAESGATVADVIDYTTKKGFSGFEHFAGIPSSIGGALWQNLHFLSPDRSKTMYIADIVTGAKILKTDGNIEHVGKEYFAFDYDYSSLHDTHDVVLHATFQLTPEDPKVLADRISANIQWRDEKHPTNAVKKSAGSIFKKIEGYGAGRLIEQVGLKGKMIGGAKISDKHANFILNENGATATDVLDLIELVKKSVKEQLGLAMQTEISFVGEF